MYGKFISIASLSHLLLDDNSKISVCFGTNIYYYMSHIKSFCDIYKNIYMNLKHSKSYYILQDPTGHFNLNYNIWLIKVI